MKQRAFVRYTKSGKIVPGSMIITQGDYPKGPATWAEVTVDLCCDNPVGPTTPSKKMGWVRYTKAGKIVPGSLVITDGYPKGSGGTWKRVSIDLCCDNLPSNCIEFVVDTTDSLNFGMSTVSLSQDYTVTVTWGDGNTEELSSGEGIINFSHDYASVSTYTVRVCFSDITVINEIEFFGND